MSEPTSDAPEKEDASEPESAPAEESTPGEETAAGKKGAKGRDPGRILRIQVPVIAVLAEKPMKLAEVLKFNVGSIIQLDKPADELFDLMVNDQRVGRGETVRIGENFGLQLVDIGSLQETIRKLGKTAEAESEDAEEAEAAEEAEPAAEVQSKEPPAEQEPAEKPPDQA